MFKNGKWHEFSKIKDNDSIVNLENYTDETGYLNQRKSHSETLQQNEISKLTKTALDSISDKQNNYERKTPTLKPTQNNPRPKLDVAKVLKHKNRLSF